MPSPNQAAIAALTAAQKSHVEAYLIEYSVDPASADRLWTFFLNPSVLSFSGETKYTASDTYAARVQDQQFGNSTGLTLEIANLYLDSYCMGKSLRPLLEGINELRKADLKNSKFNPPILSFVFGARRFSPCVITRVKWDEAAWLGGEPARAQLSITLMEVPVPGERGVAAIPPEPEAPTDGSPPQELTERQRQDGSTKAKEWLNANVGSLETSLQSIVRTNRYRLSTDAKTGDVTIFDLEGKSLGTVGRWDGATLTTENINALKKQ
ncbi:MAG: hypothetical protein HC781_06340 [Leptolyngbyaceae cyanobacterium CSU_1_4]|nr:hypothetical protein [Leptolyngbyaceae cyanobacterium CSU_1_4]